MKRTSIAALSCCLFLSACAHTIDLSFNDKQQGPLADFEELVAQHPPLKNTQLVQAPAVTATQAGSPKTGGAK